VAEFGKHLLQEERHHDLILDQQNAEFRSAVAWVRARGF
jgi:hypothetical protein